MCVYTNTSAQMNISISAFKFKKEQENIFQLGGKDVRMQTLLTSELPSIKCFSSGYRDSCSVNSDMRNTLEIVVLNMFCTS